MEENRNKKKKLTLKDRRRKPADSIHHRKSTIERITGGLQENERPQKEVLLLYQLLAVTSLRSSCLQMQTQEQDWEETGDFPRPSGSPQKLHPAV